MLKLKEGNRMKKLIFLPIFSIFFFAIPNVHADCNIGPVAKKDLNILYRSFRVDLPKPKLKIDYGKLKAIDEAAAQPYGMDASKKKFYLGAYTQKNKIVVYNKIFKLHKTCDEQVKSKLRGMLAHEYAHYLDSFSTLSSMLGTSNDEQTAIIGEHAFAGLVWPNKKTIFTRALTSSEQINMTKLKNFFQKYKR